MARWPRSARRRRRTTRWRAAARRRSRSIVTPPRSSSWVSCNGTQMNCAGGATPWGTWITCEETVNGPDVGPDFTGADNRLLERQHGYIFEVPVSGGRASMQAPADPRGRPLRARGRRRRPETGILYQTEDNFDFPSGFYRYIAPQNPMQVRELRDGGRLEMLKIKGLLNAQARSWSEPWRHLLRRVGHDRRAGPDVPGRHHEQPGDRLRW